jgi:hypothetical protein
MKNSKTISFSLVVTLAAALSACGSGGDGDTPYKANGD